MITQGHYRAADIKKKISSLSTMWTRLKELSQLRQRALEDALKAQQYFSDAQEAESWMKEKEPIVSSADFGKDEDSAQVFSVCMEEVYVFVRWLVRVWRLSCSIVQALLKKHELVINDIEAYSSTISSLEEQAVKCKVYNHP